MHNIKVLKSGGGLLAVTYRPRSMDGTGSPEDYGPCPNCYGYYPRRQLWRHNKSCKFATKSCKKERTMFATASYAFLPKTHGGSELLTNVLSCMKADEVGRIAKSDSLILAFGEKLCSRHGHDKDQHNYIRQKLRELSRLLQEMRQKKITMSITRRFHGSKLL